MARLASMAVILAACSSEEPLSPSGPDAPWILPFQPIDPLDPMLGAWDAVGVDGLPALDEPGWVFEADGTYRSSGAAPGIWDRVNSTTIRRCILPCTKETHHRTAIEGEYMMLDGIAGLTDGWTIIGNSGCFAHGSTQPAGHHIRIRANGVVQGTDYTCIGAVIYAACDGSWTALPHGLAIESPCARFGYHLKPSYVRVADDIGELGYRRAQ